MKLILLFKFILISTIFGQEKINSSFQDTLYLDSTSGNYIIEFLGKSSIDYSDSIVTMVFVPPTKIDPFIDAKIKFMKDSSYFLYDYKISNGINAEQNLFSFYLFFNTKTDVKNKQSNNYHGGRYNDIDHRIGWWGDGGLEPTWSTNGFKLSSLLLPGIGLAGMKGATSMLKYKNGFPSKHIEKKIFELSVGNSSFKMLPTVIPVNKKSIDNFDSLLYNIKNLNDSSYKFEWIKDKPTYNKYSTLLINAKTALEQNDTITARVHLQDILTNTILDSSITLTSEAFALLYFNTEYLLNQLPETFIGDMFDILINHIKNCYEKKWIDNKGIFNSLTKKVENARKQYEKGKIKTSKNKLNAFNNELNAQKGKHLNEACYNLLFKYSNSIIQKLQ